MLTTGYLSYLKSVEKWTYISSWIVWIVMDRWRFSSIQNVGSFRIEDDSLRPVPDWLFGPKLIRIRLPCRPIVTTIRIGSWQDPLIYFICCRYVIRCLTSVAFTAQTFTPATPLHFDSFKVEDAGKPNMTLSVVQRWKQFTCRQFIEHLIGRMLSNIFFLFIRCLGLFNHLCLHRQYGGIFCLYLCR